MNYFWKVFLSIFIFIAVSFGLCGTWLIHSSFISAYDREIEMGNAENAMYQVAFKNAVDAVPITYLKKKPDILGDIAESLQNSMTREGTLQVWYKEKAPVYTKPDAVAASSLFDRVDLENSGYEIEKENGKYILRVLGMTDTQFSEQPFFVETETDITHIYKERLTMTRTYQAVMCILMVFTGLLSAGLSYYLILPIITHAKNQESFTSAFAHELKTPLTAIIGYADMIRSMELTKEEQVKSAGYIYSQGKRLESLSFKLMDLFAMRKQKLELQTFDAEYLLETVFDLSEVGFLEKDIVLKREVEAGKIYGEKDLLISLFANLLDNARKASEAGSTTCLYGKAMKDGYKVIIKDEGKGIPKDEINKITQAFYMVDKSRSRKEGGAGLGMTLCNEIVHLHGAKWKFDSELGEGTTVTVFIPAAEQNEPTEEDNQNEEIR